MRLLERTLQTVLIAPQKAKTDALGAAVEGFSDERTEVRARVIPSSGGLEDRASGRRRVQSMCLLMPPGAVVAPGDGLHRRGARGLAMRGRSGMERASGRAGGAAGGGRSVIRGAEALARGSERAEKERLYRGAEETVAEAAQAVCAEAAARAPVETGRLRSSIHASAEGLTAVRCNCLMAQRWSWTSRQKRAAVYAAGSRYGAGGAGKRAAGKCRG